MVSTRQMSSIGGASGGSDVAAPSGSEPAAVPRVTRHSSALLPGGSSPHASTSKCTALVPVPKTYSTNLLDLPVEVIEKIFCYVGFKNVSQIRMVNRQFNTISSNILNYTFQRLQNQMLHRFQSIKAKMPRRESARRSHPLACESDIIETLHMRLSLLQMTFGKHIERKHCCFFPGEILDEVYGILSYLKTTTKLARPYKVTDELFDLTTMAMEYFKEHIEPNLPEITYFGTDFFDITNAFSPGESSKSFMCLDSPPPSGFDSSPSQAAAGVSTERRVSTLNMNMYMEESLPPSPPPPQSNMVLRKRIHRIKQGMKKYNDQLSALRSDLRSCKRKTALQQKQIAEQQKQIAEQQKQTLEYANRLDDYDKKNEETSRKFQTLLQELNKCKTELQYWRSRSPAVPPLCAECGASLRLSPSSSLWGAGTSAETAEAEALGTCCEGGFPTCMVPDASTELPRPEPPKPELKAKSESKPDSKAKSEGKPDSKAKPEGKSDSKAKPDSKSDKSKSDTKVDKSKAESKEPKSKETKVEKTKTEYKTDSGGEGSASTPPSRRRASADATNITPDRKKRRLTRPRKL